MSRFGLFAAWDDAPAPPAPRFVEKVFNKFGFLRSGVNETKKETMDEFYKRMEMENKLKAMEWENNYRKEKEAERIRKEEQRRNIEERRLLEEQIRNEEEKRLQERRERERKALEEKAKEEMELMSRLLEESQKQQLKALEEDRQRREFEMAMRREEEASMAERMRKEAAMHAQRELEKTRRQFLAMENLKKLATEELRTAADEEIARSKAAAMHEIQQLAIETESQKNFNAKTSEMACEIAKRCAVEAEKTTNVIKALETSIEQTKKKEEEKRRRAAEENAHWLKMQQESIDICNTRTLQEKEQRKRREEEQAERQEQERLKQQCAEEKEKKNLEDSLEETKVLHAARLSEIRKDEALLYRKREEQVAKQRLQWMDLREQFAAMIGGHLTALLREDAQQQWDARFAYMRSTFIPVQDAFQDIQQVQVDDNEVDWMPVQLEYFGDTLNSLSKTINEERRQVEAWQVQQPNAHFLVDYLDALNGIAENALRAEDALRLLERMLAARDGAQDHADVDASIGRVACSVAAIEQAVQRIPTVRAMHAKYGDI